MYPKRSLNERQRVQAKLYTQFRGIFYSSSEPLFLREISSYDVIISQFLVIGDISLKIHHYVEPLFACEIQIYDVINLISCIKRLLTKELIIYERSVRRHGKRSFRSRPNCRCYIKPDLYFMNKLITSTVYIS